MAEVQCYKTHTDTQMFARLYLFHYTLSPTQTFTNLCWIMVYFTGKKNILWHLCNHLECSIWENVYMTRVLIRFGCVAGIVNETALGDGREYSNISRWIGCFAVAVLNRLLNKVLSCPKKEMDRGKGRGTERQRERWWKGYKGGALAAGRVKEWGRKIERREVGRETKGR